MNRALLKGNPRFFSLLSILNACGLELTIHPRTRKKPKRTSSTTKVKKKAPLRPRIRRTKKAHDFILGEDREE